ncbi:hypothetical protein [Rhizobium sp. LEGMi135b]
MRHPNPVQTDGNGYFPPVFFDAADGFYRERLTSAQGVIIYDVDGLPIIGPSTGGGGGGDTPVDPSSGLITGDMIMGYGSGTRTGFVRANARTIGNAISGASECANSDAQALFSWLWNADPNLTVVGGRGANALADWNANKQMALPDRRGRALIGTDVTGNIAASVIPGAGLGWAGGEAAHILSVGEMPSHAHGLSDPGQVHNWGNTARGFAMSSGNVGGLRSAWGVEYDNSFYRHRYVTYRRWPSPQQYPAVPRSHHLYQALSTYEANFAPVSNRADWFGTIELINDDTNEILTDFDGLSVLLELRSRSPQCRILSASTDDGHIELTADGVIQWHFTVDEMRRLTPGTYEIGITITREDITEQELIGSVPVIDGIVRT